MYSYSFAAVRLGCSVFAGEHKTAPACPGSPYFTCMWIWNSLGCFSSCFFSCFDFTVDIKIHTEKHTSKCMGWLQKNLEGWALSAYQPWDQVFKSTWCFLLYIRLRFPGSAALGSSDCAEFFGHLDFRNRIHIAQGLVLLLCASAGCAPKRSRASSGFKVLYIYSI